MSSPLVSIAVITYGHQEFIEECLLSILNQEVDFEYEIIVSNDCSPDNTDEVINKLLYSHPKSHLIRYIKHEKNLGMWNNFIFTINSCNAKYIATIEGDDYWVDINKLQRQKEFLEKNKEYSICIGNYTTDNDLKNINSNLNDFSGITYILKNGVNNIKSNYLTMFFIKNKLDINVLKNYKYASDNVIMYYLLKQGLGFCFNDVFAFRRVHSGGIWSSKPEHFHPKMDYLQNDELYQYADNKAFIRKKLFFSILELIKTKRKYIKENLEFSNFKLNVQALLLIRNLNEFRYFLKNKFI